jgi:hypothetical protein
VISAAQLDPVRAVLEEHTRMVGATLEWVEPLPDAWDLGLARNPATDITAPLPTALSERSGGWAPRFRSHPSARARQGPLARSPSNGALERATDPSGRSP